MNPEGDGGRGSKVGGGGVGSRAGDHVTIVQILGQQLGPGDAQVATHANHLWGYYYFFNNNLTH